MQYLHRLFLAVSLVTLPLVVAPLTGSAAERTPFRGTVAVSGLSQLESTTGRESPGRRAITPISIQASIWGKVFSVVLTHEKIFSATKSDTSNARFLQGHVLLSKRMQKRYKYTLAASAVLSNGELKVNLRFPQRGNTKRFQPLEISGILAGDGKFQVRTKHVMASALKNNTCGEVKGARSKHALIDDHQPTVIHAHQPADGKVTTAQTGPRNFFVRAVADAQFKGGRTVAETKDLIRSTLNDASAEAYISSPLDLDLDITGDIIVLTNDHPLLPWRSDIADYIEDFERYIRTLGQAPKPGTNVLFSGKKFGSTVGYAYLAEACRSDFGNLAVVTRFVEVTNYTSRVLAHELGHSINAYHSSNGGVMWSTIDDFVGNPWSFMDQLSRAQAYVDARPSCFPRGGASAPSTPPLTTYYTYSVKGSVRVKDANGNLGLPARDKQIGVRRDTANGKSLIAYFPIDSSGNFNFKVTSYGAAVVRLYDSGSKNPAKAVGFSPAHCLGEPAAGEVLIECNFVK